jgi:hypothetical protein
VVSSPKWPMTVIPFPYSQLRCVQGVVAQISIQSLEGGHQSYLEHGPCRQLRKAADRCEQKGKKA